MNPPRVVSFVISSVIMCSSACALPVSSFPNIIAFGLADKNGKPYLETTDYMKASVPVEIAAVILMATLGWEMTKLIQDE